MTTYEWDDSWTRRVLREREQRLQKRSRELAKEQRKVEETLARIAGVKR